MESPRQIGKYEVAVEVGSGGFGTVYRCLDPILKRDVAVKLCTSADPGDRERLLREALTLANLHHRNVVNIFDVGETPDGCPYLVEELLEGANLARCLGNGRSRTWKAKILVQVCEGLEYLHQQGVVHRDIKPSNIWVRPDDSVVLLDFGIARTLRDATRLTATGDVIGTIAFLAPERVRGLDATASSDVFAVGVVAYELLTGDRPFTGENPGAILHRILSEDPQPPHERDPGIPQSLSAWVMHALAKEPARRYCSCMSMADDLRQWLRHREVE